MSNLFIALVFRSLFRIYDRESCTVTELIFFFDIKQYIPANRELKRKRKIKLELKRK